MTVGEAVTFAIVAPTAEHLICNQGVPGSNPGDGSIFEVIMLRPVMLTYGTDPEGFFERDGQIIGSSRVLPVGGLINNAYGKPFVVEDGVQFELNPAPANTVHGLATNLENAFGLLRGCLESQPGVSLNWDKIVTVSRTELDALDQKARELGCLPSMNIYGSQPLRCDVKTYRKRSPGGHVHVGLEHTNIFSHGRDARQRLIPLYDIFVGQWCVLLDRDPGAAERRENYGRAGEFRLPEHGVEYRTLDNFWVRSYTLMSFVFGMTNLATSILVHTIAGGQQEKELVNIVNVPRMRKAIEKNDIRLATRNILELEPWLSKNLPATGFPIRPGMLRKFVELGKHIDHHGITSVFPDDPLTHWKKGVRVDFTTFLERL